MRRDASREAENEREPCHEAGFGSAPFQAEVARLGATVAYRPSALGAAAADELFSTLLRDIPWVRETDAFGPQGRLTFYCGDPGCVFAYVGLRLRPHRWPAAVLRAREEVARSVGLPPEDLTACLLNYYPDGTSSIPWHYDEVRAHGDACAIAALSLGSPRLFEVRRRAPQETPALISRELQPGSVLYMAGSAQAHFEHRLPLRDGDGARISLTFRSIVPHYESLGDTFDPCVARDAREPAAKRARR